jgi:hypothetical protein
LEASWSGHSSGHRGALAGSHRLAFLFAHPPFASASKLLAEANRLRLIGDNIPAAALLEQAVALAPDAPDVHLARAAVFENLGHNNQARAEALEAGELAARQGRTEPDAEARISALDLDVPDSIQIVRAMLTKQPASMDLLQELAGLELFSSNAADALIVIDAARRLPDAARNPELDRLEGVTAARDRGRGLG